METSTFDAAIRWQAQPLAACVPSPAPELRRRVDLGGGESFGLLERAGDGWTLCIPDGADVVATVGNAPVDLCRLSLEPSGERRLRLCEGLRARVQMGEFCFELAPSA